MLRIHENTARGQTRTGWIDARHSFSFGNFMDPTRMGAGRLRVVNEDHIIPGAGFPAHDHAAMDILTYVISGAVRHEDSLGNSSVTRAGEVQLMRAGTGLTHSERNASDTEDLHLYQIWIIPDRADDAPGYQARRLADGPRGPALEAVAGGEGLTLGSSARVFRVRPGEGDVTSLPIAPGRVGFVQIVGGLARVEDETLRTGDGLEAMGESLPPLTWATEGEALYFDLPQAGGYTDHITEETDHELESHA